MKTTSDITRAGRAASAGLLALAALTLAACGKTDTSPQPEPAETAAPSVAMVSEDEAGEAAAAPTRVAKIETSPDDQSIDEFAEEWRRARKLMRACGLNDETMATLTQLESFLVLMKAAKVKEAGGAVNEDLASYSLGHEDSFAPTQGTCDGVADALEPMLYNANLFFACLSDETTTSCSEPSLFRAPRFE